MALVLLGWWWQAWEWGDAYGAPEASEIWPGGATTRNVNRRPSFQEPAKNLSLNRQLQFYVGRSFFRDSWLVPPTTTTARDGLGPLFNARSCVGCHRNGGRGRPPRSAEEPMTSMVLQLSVPGAEPQQGAAPEPTYGAQLQTFGIALTQNRGLSRANGALAGSQPLGEGFPYIRYTHVDGHFPDGQPWELQQPSYAIRDLSYGPLHPQTLYSPRVALPLIGLGLLEAIPESALLANADPSDADRDGISGRPNRVWSLAAQQMQFGRFGWKATQPTLKQQTAAAFRNDIGITNVLYPNESCTLKQPACSRAPHGRGPDGAHEIADDLLDATTYFVRFLAVPKRRNADAPEVRRGWLQFRRAHCAACHTPRHVTGEVAGFPELSNQIIWPYTDLLLHDMGPGLADERPVFAASGQEWRTPPLWGLGLTQRVSGQASFLHDGRARNLTEAILWHDGEARAAREAFSAMTRDDREALIAFLKSL